MDGSRTVILVDDNAATRRALALALEHNGYPVKVYASAEELLENLDSGQLGCLLLDLRMPGMNGLEVQEALHARDCTLPVIFMSAFADVPVTVQALQGGAVDFIEKPFSVDTLIPRIEQALALDRSQREQREWHEMIRVRAESLTPREIEVMHAVAEGLSNKVIAKQLGISPRTVEKYRARAMEKMKAENVPQLCRMVSELG